MKQFKRFSAPLLILLSVILAHGLQIHRLGFYWDDWVFVYRYQTLGLLNTIFYGGTRQLGVFALAPGFLFAGDTPLLWHIYSLLLRWLVALAFWWLVKLIWPRQGRLLLLAAILFAIHPAFTQQSIAVVYSIQFFAYGLFLLSLSAMVIAAREPKRFGWVSLLALLGQVHLFIGEYYFGLELIRPVILYILLSGPFWQRVRSSLVGWLPYLLVLGIFLAWRLGVFGAGFDDYGYDLFITAFREDPRLASMTLLAIGLQDVVVILFTAWARTLSPDVIDFSQPFNIVSLVVAGLLAMLLPVLLTRLTSDEPTNESADASFAKQAALLGGLAVLAGFLPGWYVVRHIAQPGHFGDRFALPSIFGASLLVVALLAFVADRRNQRHFLLAAVMIGLAVGYQMRAVNNYRWDWERQQRIYWQLYWRAPALLDGTVIVGNAAITTTAVTYAAAYAFNNVYDTPSRTDLPPVWYVNYFRTPISSNLQAFISGDIQPVDRFANVEFPLTPQTSLPIFYTNERSQCLVLLQPGDELNQDIDEAFHSLTVLYNPALISTEGGGLPPARIFGPEPEPGWCMFYQKAELALERGDIQQVLALKQQADAAGQRFLNAHELFPFVEAALAAKEYDLAFDISAEAARSLLRTRPGLCRLWQVAGEMDSSAAYRQAYVVAASKFSCPSP